jgi:HD-GYP domain-containing protein (c-di-GMP phosphodiesterase class II)
MSAANEDKLTAQLAETLALECGFHPTVASRIRLAAAVHDIGKILVPGFILNKPGKLTAQEFEVIKTHTILGAELLSDMPRGVREMAMDVSRWHHEWYNGRGYWGRYTDELPPYVPIVAIADVYVALTNIRPYKSAWTKRKALEYIHDQSGRQFNSLLVKIFLKFMRSGRG